MVKCSEMDIDKWREQRHNVICGVAGEATGIGEALMNIR